MGLGIFLDKYDPDELVYVFNPTREDFSHSIQGSKHTIPAMGELRLKRHLADLISSKLAKKMVSSNKVITQKDTRDSLKKIRLYPYEEAT